MAQRVISKDTDINRGIERHGKARKDTLCCMKLGNACDWPAL
jgi:hypothetical protein